MLNDVGPHIDGAWRVADGEPFHVVNPATEEVLATLRASSRAQVAAAVEAARAAMREGPWPRMSFSERLAIVQSVQAAFAERVESFAWLQTTQMGMPMRRSLGAINGIGGLIDGYANDAADVLDDHERDDARGRYLILRRPVGVVAAIAPWNGPTAIAISKIVPALLAGCAVVFKPAPETPFDACELASLFDAAGLPPGVLNIVLGGRDAGEALVEHPEVAMVHFTGSTAAGGDVWQRCGSTFKRMTMELGGKSAGIILDDADVEGLLPILLDSNFSNSGQVCKVLSRMLVPRKRASEILDMLVEATRALRVGDPLDVETDVGPLVAERQRDRVEGYLASAEREGARRVSGGGRPRHLASGWYLEPAILAEVDNQMTVAREEIFGPVMSVLVYDTDDEAVTIANDSKFGLFGGVFSGDVERALDVARRFDTGAVGVNCFAVPPSAPVGGRKCSGIGREHGPEGLLEFVEYQTVVLPPLDSAEAASPR